MLRWACGGKDAPVGGSEPVNDCARRVVPLLPLDIPRKYLVAETDVVVRPLRPNHHADTDQSLMLALSSRWPTIAGFGGKKQTGKQAGKQAGGGREVYGAA